MNKLSCGSSSSNAWANLFLPINALESDADKPGSFLRIESDGLESFTFGIEPGANPFVDEFVMKKNEIEVGSENQLEI